MTIEEEILYDEIIERGIATENEISLVRAVCSDSWGEILNKIVFIKTGYKTMEQLIDCEED